MAEFYARDEDFRISTYRTGGGAEVDFIVEHGRNITAIEVKAGRSIGKGDLRGLASFREFVGKTHRSLVFYQGDQIQDWDGIKIIPILEGIKYLFDGSS